MDQMAGFCRSKAAEYTRRAEDTSDKQVRKFLYLMRDNWIAAAKDHEKAAAAKASRQLTPPMQSLDRQHHSR
jgi:hypothetical protein